jgi:hypothetical protein
MKVIWTKLALHQFVVTSDLLKLVAKDRDQRRALRQLIPTRAQDARARAERPPGDFADDAVGLRVIGRRISNASIDIAHQAGDDRVQVHQKLVYGAGSCGVRRIGDIRRGTARFQLVVARSHGLNFKRLDTVEDRRHRIGELGVGYVVRIAGNHLVDQPRVAVDRPKH